MTDSRWIDHTGYRATGATWSIYNSNRLITNKRQRLIPFWSCGFRQFRVWWLAAAAPPAATSVSFRHPLPANVTKIGNVSLGITQANIHIWNQSGEPQWSFYFGVSRKCCERLKPVVAGEQDLAPAHVQRNDPPDHDSGDQNRSSFSSSFLSTAFIKFCDLQFARKMNENLWIRDFFFNMLFSN